MRWGITLLTSMGGLVTVMSGAMLAPALSSISHDLQISEDEANMVVSIFVLAFAFGPMVLAPLAEVFGRRPVWLVCSTWFVVWKTYQGSSSCGADLERIGCERRVCCGWRGLSAILKCIQTDDVQITNPVLGDCWQTEQRGHSFAVATFIPLLGSALGPILGGIISNRIGWSWLFWVLSIFDGALIIYAFFFFPETYGQLILHRKAVRLQKETGRPYHTQRNIHSQPLINKLRNSLVRPCWMLATQQTIQMMAVFMACNFGVLYFVLTSFATLWTDQYHQSVQISGVH